MNHNSKFLDLVNDAKSRIKECDILTLKKEINNNSNSIVVDVREREEFLNGHIPNSVHLSRGMIEVVIERVIPNKETKLFLYCGGGFRSALSADNLCKMGYRNVVSVDGGFREWANNNFEIVK